MGVFTDDFNRANGALGGNWTAIAGTLAIVSNAVTATGTSSSFNTTVSDLHYQEASANLTWNNTAFAGPAVLVCVAADGTGGFSTKLRLVTSAPTLSVTSGGYGGSSYLIDYTLPTPIPPFFNVRLVWADGALTLYYNGASVGTANSALYIGAPYMGIGAYAGYGSVLDFRAVSTATIGLSVSPSTIGNYGGACSELALTGTNTAWTTGTPGTPTFTVNHGTISAQEVLSATTATITYCPGDYLGAITFTDPSTGAVAGAVVTSDPNTVPPSGTVFSQAVVDYLERSAVAQTTPTILNQEAVVGEAGAYVDVQTAIGDLRLGAYKNTYEIEGYSSTAKLLYILFGLLSGYHPPREGVFAAPSTTTLKEDLDFLRARWEDSGHVSPWTLEQVRDALAGDPPASHQDILTALDGISVDLGPVLDAISAMQGDPLVTLKVVMDLVYLLDPTGTHNLAEVLTAIGNVRGSGAPDIAAVMSKLALIQTGNLPDLATIDQHISTMSAVVAAIDLVTGSTATAVGGVATVADDIYDIVSGLQDQIGTTPTSLWPGEDKVTLGTEVALADGLEVTGPLNGLLITITGYPVRTQNYMFGDVASWSRVGAVIFATDRGDYERSQTFSLDRQVLIPQTMEVAGSAILRVNFGWEGTVRGWTRNA